MNFGSDNTTGASPEIMAALQAANAGQVMPYGNDELTHAVEARVAALFETPARVFLVPTGTAANALALASLCPPHGAVFCHAMAHIHTDECGAPEFYTGGAKLVPLSGGYAKVRAVDLASELSKPDRGVHHVRPSAVSISQVAETGAVYTPDEVRTLCAIAKEKGLKVHMDGARFANALAALGCSAADLTWRAGIDVLCFGATKNGALMAEAVVVFDPALAEALPYRRKRSGHLASKMRFLAAQFDAYLAGGLWLRNATHANAVAKRIADGLSALPGCTLAWPADANEVFVDMPIKVADGLQADGFGFYRWQPEGGRVRIRLVAAFSSDPADADALVAAARRYGEKT